MAQSLVWGGDDVRVACRVCGAVGVGHLLVTVTLTEVGDLDARQCAACGSLDLLDDPLSFADTDEVIDAYVEAGAGLGAMLGALAVVDHRRIRRFLDVGCGYGFSVDMAARLWGWDARGVEPEWSGRRGSAELGVPIEATLPPPPADPADAFDLVFASEVVEHLTEPVSFLAGLGALVGPDGLLLLTTPAADAVTPDSAAHVVLAALAPGYHTFLASEIGLAQLLRRAGFSELRVVRSGATLYAAAGHLDLLHGGAGGRGPVPDASEEVALVGRYLDARRAESGGPTALASGLTTRRLRGLVAAGAWPEVPAALAQATDVLARRHGVVLDDPGERRRQVAGGGELPPVTLPAVAFSAGMWALVDDRPEEARELFDLAAAAARRLVAAGVPLLEFVDLEVQGAGHAAVAAARVDPADAVRRLSVLTDPSGRWHCRVFTEIVVAGGLERLDPTERTGLVGIVGAAAGILSTDDDADLARIGVDALYALGIESLVSLAPGVALGWFQRCRDAALHGAAAESSAHLVAVADEHLRLARSQLPGALPHAVGVPCDVVPADRPTLTHHIQSYWCDASGVYVDGWVASVRGTPEVLGIRLGDALHPPLAWLPPGLDPRDGRRTPFAVLAIGSPHAPVALVVRVGGRDPTGSTSPVAPLEVPLDLPAHGLPPRPPSSNDLLSDVLRVGELVAPWLERAPEGPVLAVGMRQAPDADELTVHRIFGGREVVSVDIHPGPGVSLVADVHDLSSDIEQGSFAIVYSVSVLEHLRVPWVAAAQMARALMPGGLALQGAPWVFPTHSEPNDFWRMSSAALATLFGPEMGFEVLDTLDGAAVTVVPEPSWRAAQPLNLRMPTLVSSSMSWLVARKVAATPEVVWPLNPEASRRVAEDYPLDGVVPFDTHHDGGTR